MTSSKNRPNYHHGDLRAEILREALHIVETQGDHALSLRSCARTVGVDIAAFYRHFKNKDAVLTALSGHGHRELARSMHTSMQDVGRTPSKARTYFTRCGHAYVSFGLNHPNLYRLMFSGRCRTISPSDPNASTEPSAYDLLSDALDLLLEVALIHPMTRQNAELFAWSSIHGLTSLLLDGRVELPEDTRNAHIDHHCALILQGLTLLPKIL